MPSGRTEPATRVKARRITPGNRSRQLGAIREITSDPFDILLAVFFDGELTLTEVWAIPKELVAEASFVARTNSTRFVLTGARMMDRRVTQLYPGSSHK